jgi:hypothetical protein
MEGRRIMPTLPVETEWKPKAKDRSMICRMAGNIAGPLAAATLEFYERHGVDIPCDFLEREAKTAVELAVNIVREAESVETYEGS